MKKMIKSFRTMIVIMLLCLVCAVPAFAASTIPEATSDFYVNDFAKVFSEEQKASLMNNAVALANENDGVQVVVTTVTSLEGATVEDYAYDMYNKYGIGKEDMGLLILLSTEDRKIRVEVGKAMEAHVNDAKAGRFIDKYAIPYLKENKFDKGLINLQQALITEIKDSVVRETAASAKQNKDIVIDWASVALVAGIIIGIGAIVFVVILIMKKIKTKKEYVEELEDEIEKLKSEKRFMKESHEENMQALRDRNSELRAEKDEFKKEYCLLSDELKQLKDRQKRATQIYPDVEKKIDDMIEAEKIAFDKQAAKAVDDLIISVLCMKASKDIVNKVSSVVNKYDILTDSQKQYITADVKRLKSLQSECFALEREYERQLEEERQRKLAEQRKNKANNVTEKILAVIALVGFVSASDLYRLRDAKALYDNLDYETQKFVDKSAIAKLESLISDAKRKKDEEEEEERRRRQASYHSSSSFGGGSSFRGGGHGGFGGRSGGGGASRGF